MTDLSELDRLLETQPLAEPTLAGEPTPRKCRRHVWEWTQWMLDQSRSLSWVQWCKRCHRLKDEVRSRRGKSSRRLGHDGERRSEKRYGWEKIGERGQMTDLRGKMFKAQQKTSRRAAPALFRAVFPALDASKDGRIPLILLSYVKAGVGTEDYVILRGSDWLDLHGRDAPDPGEIGAILGTGRADE